MSMEFILNIAQQTIKAIILISAPMLIAGLLAGILISVLQAVTQIQEMTLTFVPKIIAVVLAIIIFGPWMLQIIIDFTVYIFSQIPNCVR